MHILCFFFPSLIPIVIDWRNQVEVASSFRMLTQQYKKQGKVIVVENFILKVGLEGICGLNAFHLQLDMIHSSDDVRAVFYSPFR